MDGRIGVLRRLESGEAVKGVQVRVLYHPPMDAPTGAVRCLENSEGCKAVGVRVP